VPVPKTVVDVRASLLSLLVDPASIRLHALMIAGYSAALFLPLIGRGFVHDDFVHLYSVVFDPLRQGLTKANGGPFYAPLAWLSYKIDWMLWGWNPLAFAAVNLTLHISNILLVYHLALRLYRSVIAARWAAIGFALLFPANTWAVMWISTRAHLIVTLFYLAAMLATVWYARTERYRVIAFITIVSFSALAIFSKESAVTVPAAIALILFSEKVTRKQICISRSGVIGLFATLFAILLVYAGVRAQSGAIPITFSGNLGYYYALSPKMLLEHLLRYGWRTYGLLTILAGAITLSQYFRGRTHYLRSLTRKDIFFSIALFTITIAPFILLPTRSGIYSYLPGIAAALLLGATARSLYKSPLKSPARANVATLSPIIIVIVIYSSLTVGHSLRWKKMAETSAAVLHQIVAQQPRVEPNALIILTYARVDNERRFPESIAWGFPSALRVLYGDSSVDGKIIRQGEKYGDNAPEIHFAYTLSNSWEPRVTGPKVLRFAGCETSF